MSASGTNNVVFVVDFAESFYQRAKRNEALRGLIARSSNLHICEQGSS